jgi:hypothetical protein
MDHPCHWHIQILFEFTFSLPTSFIPPCCYSFLPITCFRRKRNLISLADMPLKSPKVVKGANGVNGAFVKPRK